MSVPIIDVRQLTHRYGRHVALDQLDLTVHAGELFGLLGPNGSGKTTLFRILSTLIPPVEGTVRLFGLDLLALRDEARRGLGVVFQVPSLDKQLSASENLMHHGHLYGLGGKELRQRIADMLERFGLSERSGQRVGSFSGGMRRKVELAKALLTRPRLLILDEPSTGLDPAARIDLWHHLDGVRREGTTILLTTHLMDEADRCDRLGILYRGKMIAMGAPEALTQSVGGDIITLTTQQPELLEARLTEMLGHRPQRIQRLFRIERPNALEQLPALTQALFGLIDSIAIGKPTLEDVFIQVTGHQFGRVVNAE